MAALNAFLVLFVNGVLIVSMWDGVSKLKMVYWCCVGGEYVGGVSKVKLVYW